MIDTLLIIVGVVAVALLLRWLTEPIDGE